jgi:hypothetical protein
VLTSYKKDLGKRMRRAGREISVGFLALAVTGFLMLAGGGTARAKPAALPAACNEVIAAGKSYTAGLTADTKKYPAHSAAVRTAVEATLKTYENEILKITAHGSPTLKNDVKVFFADLNGVLTGHVNGPKLEADGNRMALAACTPSGAPRTGGGSSARLQDPAVLGAAGAAALAGLAVIVVALRSRSRTRAELG